MTRPVSPTTHTSYSSLYSVSKQKFFHSKVTPCVRKIILIEEFLDYYTTV